MYVQAKHQIVWFYAQPIQYLLSYVTLDQSGEPTLPSMQPSC